jgi:hypothetical protein
MDDADAHLVEDGSGGGGATVADEYTVVDHFVPEEWPPDIAAALDRWRQGDVLPGPSLFWAGPAEQDRVTGVDPGESDWDVFTNPSLRFAYGIIRSQTCDIAAGGPGRLHPFVDVAPVFDASAFDQGKRNQVEGYAVTYLAPLSRPPQDGFWVADLRLSIPVSKALLAKHSPIDVFASEADRLSFAEMIAAKLRRPALHEALSEALTASLAAFIAAGKGPDNWLDKVDQIRIAITEDRLNPSAVTVVIMSSEPLERAEIAYWRTWRKSGAKLLRGHGITLGRILILAEDKMSAKLYRQTIPLRIRGLERPPTW